MNENSARTVYYYQLLAKKHAASGLGANQARVYNELADLMAPCNTLKEMQLKMKEAGYFEKPAQALYMDKMLAHAKAARELGFEKVAQIYENRSAEVAADYKAAWVTGFEQQISDELHRISEVVANFKEIFQSYYRYQGAAESFRAEEKAKILSAMATIAGHGSSWLELSAEAFYRKFISLNDERYPQAIKAIQQIIDTDLNQAALEQAVHDRTKAMLDGPGVDQKKLTELGKDFDQRCKRAVYVCVAPQDAPGPYAMEKFFEE